LATSSAAAAALALPLRLARSTPSAEGITTIRRNVGTFTARGGTIGWLWTEESVVVIDAQFPESASACWGALDRPSGRTIDVFVNTHHHGDHTSGNKTFAPHAKVHLAHVNCPIWQKKAAEARGMLADQAVATTTFETSWKAEVGDETIRAEYFGPAHTGGDAVVFFEKANIAHVGDLVFNRLPPIIDRPAGARVRGWISVLEDLHARTSDETVFIFGHGAPAAGITGSRADLFAMRDFLTGLLEYTRAGLDAGKSVDDLAAVDRLPKFPDYYREDRKDAVSTAIRIAAEEISAKE